jgi:chemotaxis signal transduction protein
MSVGRAERKRVDWTAIHAGLALRVGPARTAAADARTTRLLDERTRVLAREVQHTPASEERMLLIRVRGERYALPLSAAREVTGLARAARMPGVRAAVTGIVNWRGEFVVVFDLATLVGAAGPSKPERMVVLTGRDPPFAIAVDAVDRIAAVDVSALRPAGDLAPGHGGLFRGTTADALLVMDAAALLHKLDAELQG